MRTPRPGHRFVIHPSIESLVDRIGRVTDATPATEIAELREACLGKVRSYPAEHYLRTVTDAVTGRARYAIVAAFSSQTRTSTIAARTARPA